MIRQADAVKIPRWLVAGVTQDGRAPAQGSAPDSRTKCAPWGTPGST
jgi:hypothetical protein